MKLHQTIQGYAVNPSSGCAVNPFKDNLSIYPRMRHKSISKIRRQSMQGFVISPFYMMRRRMSIHPGIHRQSISRIRRQSIQGYAVNPSLRYAVNSSRIRRQSIQGDSVNQSKGLLSIQLGDTPLIHLKIICQSIQECAINPFQGYAVSPLKVTPSTHIKDMLSIHSRIRRQSMQESLSINPEIRWESIQGYVFNPSKETLSIHVKNTSSIHLKMTPSIHPRVRR